MSFLNFNNKNQNSKSKNDSYTQQAQNIWSMLDDMAASDPKSYKDFIDKTIKDGKEMLKAPESHMCVQTSIFNPKNCDFYINFFTWNRVSAPKTDEDSIPIYGQPVEYHENSAFVNIAFNPSVLDKYGKNAPSLEERNMLISLAFEFIESQNEVKIDKNTFELVNDYDCYGDEKSHISKFKKVLKKDDNDILAQAYDVIESDAMPDDSVINKFLNMNLNIDPNTKNKNAPPKIKTEKPETPKKIPLIEEVNVEKPVVPKYETKFVNKNGEDYLEILIDLNKVQSMSQCDLSVDDSGQIITLKVENTIYKDLVVSLKEYAKNGYVFDVGKMNAKFIKNKSILKILLNFIK